MLFAIVSGRVEGGGCVSRRTAIWKLEAEEPDPQVDDAANLEQQCSAALPCWPLMVKHAAGLIQMNQK